MGERKKDGCEIYEAATELNISTSSKLESWSECFGKECWEVESNFSGPVYWGKSDYRILNSSSGIHRLWVDGLGSGSGFLIFREVLDEHEIIHLSVALRGIGMGSLLLERYLKICQIRKVNSSFLEVSQKNHSARMLYRKVGFEKIGQRNCYYSDGSDAILMRKCHG